MNAADVNAKDKFNRIALHYAADEGYLEIVKYLAIKGSEIDVKGAFYLQFGSWELTLGCTPLHLAARNGHLEVVKYLIYQGADVNLKNNENMNALDLAKKRDNLEMVAFLESKKEWVQLSKAGKTVAKAPVKQAPPKESIETKPRPLSGYRFWKLFCTDNRQRQLPISSPIKNSPKRCKKSSRNPERQIWI